MRALAFVLFMIVGAGCGEDIFINERRWSRVQGELVKGPSGCINASDLDGHPAKFTPRVEGSSDFGTFQTTGDGAVHILIHSQGVTLATRSYNREFLRSHRVDEFIVTTQGGVEYLLRYWGGPCTPLELDLP